MTLPTADTVVLYPAGETVAVATVLHVQVVGPADGADTRLAVLVDRTPVHPVDAAWPDQGPDAAVMRVGGREHPVVDCVVGATDGSALYLGRDIPVRKGTDGWAFVVVHLLDAGEAADAGLAEGVEVELAVDVHRREALSVGHTLCHVASLALNAALADAWRKDVRADALGSPDFDATAIATSTIGERSSVDEYRVGKSVRKAGFDVEVLADVEALASRVTETVRSWAASAASVRIERDGDALTDRRFWVCETPDGTARIACGGTHATSLAELGEPTVRLHAVQLEGAVALTMESTA